MGRKYKSKVYYNEDTEVKNIIHEVDKTCSELQIANLNRKLSRLRSYTKDLEFKNVKLQLNRETLEKQYEKEIGALKKTLDLHSDQIKQLVECLKVTQTAYNIKQVEYSYRVNELRSRIKNIDKNYSESMEVLNGKIEDLKRVSRNCSIVMSDVRETDSIEKKSVQICTLNTSLLDVVRFFMMMKKFYFYFIYACILYFLNCHFKSRRKLMPLIIYKGEFSVMHNTKLALKWKYETIKINAITINCNDLQNVYIIKKNCLLNFVGNRNICKLDNRIENKFKTKSCKDHENMLKQMKFIKQSEQDATVCYDKLSLLNQRISDMIKKVKKLQISIAATKDEQQQSAQTNDSIGSGEAEYLKNVIIRTITVIKLFLNENELNERSTKCLNIIRGFLELNINAETRIASKPAMVRLGDLFDTSRRSKRVQKSDGRLARRVKRTSTYFELERLRRKYTILIGFLLIIFVHSMILHYMVS